VAIDDQTPPRAQHSAAMADLSWFIHWHLNMYIYIIHIECFYHIMCIYIYSLVVINLYNTLQLVQSAGLVHHVWKEQPIRFSASDVWWASDKMTLCETWVPQEIHQKSIFLGVNNHQTNASWH
jgi:hypothetical protein